MEKSRPHFKALAILAVLVLSVVIFLTRGGGAGVPEQPAHWRTTPSLYPSPASEKGSHGVEVLVGPSGQVFVDGQPAAKRLASLTVPALEAAVGPMRQAEVLLRGPMPEAAQLLRTLQTIEEASFAAVKFAVFGPVRGEGLKERPHLRRVRFGGRQEPPGWVTVSLGRRRAWVHGGVALDGKSFTRVEVANGLGLFEALFEASAALERSPADCVEVRVEEAISPEHLLNAVTIAGGISAGAVARPPTTRAGLMDVLDKVGKTHCVRLALPKRRGARVR